MQQHQQQVRLQQQQRSQQQQQQQPPGNGRLVAGPQNGTQQYPGQQQHGFQQTAPRVPQSGTIAQTGFAVDSGNFPAATGHTLPNAGMPYKSANVGGFQQQQQQFNTNLGYTQITSTTNQSDMDQELQALLSQKDVAETFAENLLKQFGGSDALDIKEELPDEAGIGSSSPQNVAADSTTHTPIKCEATSTVHKAAGKTNIPKCDIKPEPVLKIEKLFGSNDSLTFSTDMDSKQIIDTVK